MAQLNQAAALAPKHVKRAAVADGDEEMVEEMEQKITPTPAPMSVQDSVASWGLRAELAKNLLDEGIHEYFPVQRLVCPFIIRQSASLCIYPKDMCVSAPTGSGKTISYALPIINTLCRTQSTRRLRALILLPTKELAKQVFGVFDRLARGTSLKIALVIGAQAFHEEQVQLVGATHDVGYNGPGNMTLSLSFARLWSNADALQEAPGSLGISLVDVVICTPGRLHDHLTFTAGFTLQHLRFMVLDEADRLLGNAYHSWVQRMVQSVESVGGGKGEGLHGLAYGQGPGGEGEEEGDERQGLQCYVNSPERWNSVPALQRLLFSATLTDNPQKLAALGIHNPEIVRMVNENAGDEATQHATQTAYTVPATLYESTTVCETVKRPLILSTILVEALGTELLAPSLTVGADDSSPTGHVYKLLAGEMCMIFSSSVETTHRLCRMLQLLNGQAIQDDHTGVGAAPVLGKVHSHKLLFGGIVAEVSRLLRDEEKAELMKNAAAGKVRILVASDQMARGMDLPNCKLVINYDVPKSAKTYVHRVGRTARANREGHAITLLKSGQVGAFRQMRSLIGYGASKTEVGSKTVKKIPKCKPNKELETTITDRVAAAIKRLPSSLGLGQNASTEIGE